MNTILTLCVAQFAPENNPQQNLSHITKLAQQAKRLQARVLLMPEGIITGDDTDSYYSANHPQSIHGSFVQGLRTISNECQIALMCSVHLHEQNDPDPRSRNVFLVIDHGQILLQYEKLHCYDTLGACESNVVAPGNHIPGVVTIDGFTIGVMICYDVRFPECAQVLADQGADIIAIAAAWARGPLKEMQWDIMTRARALENGCYVAACSESSSHTTGLSRIIDPQGVTIAAAGTGDALICATVERAKIDQTRAQLPLLENRRIAQSYTVNPE